MNIVIGEYITIVDPEDAHFLEDKRWGVYLLDGKPYVRGWYNGKNEALHRLICNTPSKMFTDHINGNTLDNRRSNLRQCTNGQNQANSKVKKNNKSGYKGVARVSKHRWRAKINKDNNRIDLGLHESPELAARAYDNAAVRIHGQFARLNFPKS